MRTSKTIKTAKMGYIIISLLFCGAGLLLIIWPEISVMVFCRIIGILLIISGAIKLVGYFSKDLYRLAFQFDLAFGLLAILLGIIMLLRTERLIFIFHFLVGVFTLADSLFKIQTAVDAKRFGIRYWWGIGITALIAGIFGIILILNPFEGAVMLMIITGITLLMEGILNLCVALCAVKILDRRI